MPSLPLPPLLHALHSHESRLSPSQIPSAIHVSSQFPGRSSTAAARSRRTYHSLLVSAPESPLFLLESRLQVTSAPTSPGRYPYAAAQPGTHRLCSRPPLEIILVPRQVPDRALKDLELAPLLTCLRLARANLAIHLRDLLEMSAETRFGIFDTLCGSHGCLVGRLLYSSMYMVVKDEGWCGFIAVVFVVEKYARRSKCAL